jgi:glycosyltransferase involved in cell wall biosynthesis
MQPDDSRADDPIEVSVVIPCLNEARSIAICIDKAIAAFEEAGIRGEVVVSDNGSTDDSVEIARSHGARVTHATRKGYGHALRKGIEAARGTFVIMGDADDSYDFSEVPRFVEKWREGYDVVMGNRFKGGIQARAMPWHHRYIGNPVLSGILRILFHTSIGDSHCGMRGFTREVYERMDLRTTGMEFASEFVIKAARLGVRITEIPITLWPDKRGRPPHLRSFRDGWRHLRFMLMYAPNWLFLAPGALLMGVGLALVVWLLPGERTVGSVSFDDNTMFFGMIFTLLGAQVIFIGLFAKVFSHTEEFDKSNIGLSRWLKKIQLETGLVVGLILTVAGLAGNIDLFLEWRRGGYGAFYEIRWMIFSSMLLFLGVQIIFSSFFLSMLGISRNTFIGDKDFQS